MNFYENFNISSQFRYGASNISQGFIDIFKGKEAKSKLAGLGKIGLGFIEVLPFIGIGPALIEKKVKNWTLNDKLKQRELFVIKEIASKSFQTQKAYFDTHSSENLGISKKLLLDQKIEILLDNSTPDRQLFSLIDDLTAFKIENEKTLNPDQINKLEQIIAKLNDSKRTALLISAIISSPSQTEKKEFQKELMIHLKARISNLKRGEKLIVPCGYMNGNIYDLVGIMNNKVTGHAMLFEIQKNDDDTFNTRLFNTGEGLESHTNDKQLEENFYPFCIDNVSKEKLLDDSFLDRLTKFSYSESTQGQEKFKPSMIYELLTKELGNPRETTSSDKSYHSQKNCGNCAKKSLQVWVHDELKGDEKLYLSFRIARLKKINKEIEEISKQLLPFFYKPALGTIGGTKAFPRSFIPLSVLGFMVGFRIKVHLSAKHIQKLFEITSEKIADREDKLIILNPDRKELTSVEEKRYIDRIKNSNGKAYSRAPEIVKSNPNVLKFLIDEKLVNSTNFIALPDSIKNDPKKVLEIAKFYPEVIAIVKNENVLKNKELIKYLVDISPNYFDYAHNELKNDKEFIGELIENTDKPLMINCLSFANKSVRYDKDLLLLSAKHLQFGVFTELPVDLQEDNEFIEKIMMYDQRIYIFLNKISQETDHNLIMRYPSIITYKKNKRKDKSLIEIIVRKTPKVFREVDEDIREDFHFILNIMKKYNINLLPYAGNIITHSNYEEKIGIFEEMLSLTKNQLAPSFVLPEPLSQFKNFFYYYGISNPDIFDFISSNPNESPLTLINSSLFTLTEDKEKILLDTKTDLNAVLNKLFLLLPVDFINANFLHFVERYPMILEFVEDSKKNDPDLFLKVIKDYPDAFIFAPESLRNDTNFVKNVLDLGLDFNFRPYLTPDLQKDRNLLLSQIKNLKKIILLPLKFSIDREFMMEALSHNIKYYEQLNPYLLIDPDFLELLNKKIPDFEKRYFEKK